MSDVNLAMGYINCRDTDSERVIPFGSQAKKALQQYMHTVRNGFLKEQESEVLFTNLFGKTDEQTGILESTETLCTDCRDRERYLRRILCGIRLLHI